VFKAWLQTKGEDNFVRTAPAAINADNVKVTNNGYGVKVKWTPTKDKMVECSRLVVKYWKLSATWDTRGRIEMRVSRH
jgi:hypothetical protein